MHLVVPRYLQNALKTKPNKINDLRASDFEK